MPIYLVRHAQAGERTAAEDDHLRELSEPGRFQASRLAERFATVPVSRVLSSPFPRCVQTVEPLATSHGLTVETSEVLAEDQPFTTVINLLLEVDDHAVLCSHGDVIPETIAALCRRGMDIIGTEDWRKGSVWVLHRAGDAFVSGSAEPPPPQR